MLSLTCRGRYWVADDDSACAGNLTRKFALDYAEGQASLHPDHAYVVVREGRKGVLHV